MKKKKVNIPFLISAFIFAGALICFVWYMFSIHLEDSGFESLREKLIKTDEAREDKDGEEAEESLSYYLINGTVVQEEFKDLYLENNDIMGWIKIDDTKLDYPVMITPEEPEYYIHKNFSGEYSFDGTPFAGAGTDYKGPDNNMIIYGHHLVNNMMFSTLDDYESEEFYKQHRYITFDTLRQTGTYEVIGAFRTQVYPTSYTGFVFYNHLDMSKDEFDDYVSNVKSLTPYKTSSSEYGDQLITLSTCAYHTSNGRFVVVAKRIGGLEVDLDKEPIEVIKTEGE